MIRPCPLPGAVTRGVRAPVSEARWLLIVPALFETNTGAAVELDAPPHRLGIDSFRPICPVALKSLYCSTW